MTHYRVLVILKNTISVKDDDIFLSFTEALNAAKFYIDNGFKVKIHKYNVVNVYEPDEVVKLVEERDKLYEQWTS